MSFKYDVAVEIRNIVESSPYEGKISRSDLVKLLIRRTGTMQPWWLRGYLQQLVTAGLFTLQADGSFEVVKE